MQRDRSTLRRVSHLSHLKEASIARQPGPVKILLTVWAVAALSIGAALTSYHQPMLAPGQAILTLAATPSSGRWQAIHVLSGACGCSQRVMRNLISRGPMQGSLERVILADGNEPYLPGTELLLRQLENAKFQVIHRRSSEIVHENGIQGLPLLVIVSPRRTVEYLGGYGIKGDQAELLMTRTLAGKSGASLPIFGCAIGERIRQKADPFGLKYGSFRNQLLLAFGKVPSV